MIIKSIQLEEHETKYNKLEKIIGICPEDNIYESINIKGNGSIEKFYYKNNALTMLSDKYIHDPIIKLTIIRPKAAIKILNHLGILNDPHVSKIKLTLKPSFEESISKPLIPNGKYSISGNFFVSKYKDYAVTVLDLKAKRHLELRRN